MGIRDGATTAVAAAGTTAAPTTAASRAPTTGQPTTTAAAAQVIPAAGKGKYGQDPNNKNLYVGPSGYTVDVSKCPADWNINQGITNSEIDMFASYPTSGPLAGYALIYDGARAYYDQQRDRGLNHHAALRQLANRQVGILHGCLRSATRYDETTAWADQRTEDHQAAA